jgi:hypothetical protein
MGNDCAKDENLDNRPIANHEINVDQSHAMRGPEMNDQFHANRAGDETPNSQDGHPPRHHAYDDSMQPYMEKMNTNLCKDLPAIDEFPEQTNDRVNLTLSRVGDFHHSSRIHERKINSLKILVADDLTISAATKVFHNSVFKGNFTFYTNDHIEAFHRTQKLDLCEGTATGKQVWDDGTVYEGSLECGRFHGAGRLVHVNGDFYEGLWENGEANGYGKWVCFEGDSYDGNWKDSRPSGMGQYDWANGSRYTGAFLDGERTGEGELVVPGKLMYTGAFQGGKFTGIGVYEFLDGSDRKYSGDFLKDQLQGKGTFTYRNGDFYYGEFESGKKSGKGIMVYANGLCWEGLWTNGLMNGAGKVTKENEVMYEGDWKHGKRVVNAKSEWVPLEGNH